ncbi:MAG: 2-C-methyl-D-erythritol 2,4-cyclodiphosphate synthase [Defluviitaleaceae bacterium]|nr:2-C-methyl-D-erythritol 2,4-cyclodiphosphate synthase [Defluviitaleaceae bacterium]
MRIGIGYDSHRFCKERELILGGVVVPHNMGLDGHSDADVLCHAIIDALLGAAKLGDIGRLFPDNDPQYKGIASTILLRDTYIAIKNEGYKIVNIDTVVIAEKPRLQPFIPHIEQSIAICLGIDENLISVKAKTNEKMGFAGRGEGILVQAVCLIEKVNI